MGERNLSLRHRKLIHYLQSRKTYTTGEELAKALHVSARTIRNDVNEINQLISDTGVRICSKRSAGYLIEARDSVSLKQLTLSSDSFLSRDERIRFIATELCISDLPINLYDLEDIMFISRTTLEHDLNEMRERYLFSYPHIQYIRQKNYISFEKDERKRRAILNLLLAENWNYNSRGNLFYRYQYLDEHVVNLIMKETQVYTTRYDIQLEDVNMVILNLTIAIMYYRISTGHTLTEPNNAGYSELSCMNAADALLDSLEEKLSCRFSALERQDIYLLLSCSRIMYTQKITLGTIEQYFDHSIIEFTNRYIRRIREIYEIDFSENENFYISVLQYFRYLKLPLHNFNKIYTNSDVTRLEFLIEFEIAYAIQPLALEFFGRFLDRTELLYLVFCISAAFEEADQISAKIKAVILCHLNQPALWNLKQKIMKRFGNYIEVVSLLSVYEKDIFDFSKINLAITTVDKKITGCENCMTQVISPFFTISDQNNLQQTILKLQVNQLYKPGIPTIRELFLHAVWHERVEFETPFEAMEFLAADFIRDHCVSEQYLRDILHRESILSFAIQPSVVLVYSNIPSKETRLSIATLEHRVKWNSYKIRIVIMAAVRPEDTTFLFRMINDLYDASLNPNDAKMIKSREEVLRYFRL